MATSAVLAVVAIVGSEPLIFLRFAEITLQNYGGAAGALSLSTLSQRLGVPPDVGAQIPRLVLVGGLALVVALRRRPRIAWVVTVLVLVFASPVTAFHTPALLLACLAPYAFARRDRRDRRDSGDPTTYPAATSKGLAARAPSS